jgi:MraZ protein
MQHLLLSGVFEHIVDAKGRITLPARYRDYFQHGANLVRFPDKEPCISVFHPDSWRDYDAKNIEPLDVFENEDDEWRMRDIYANQYFVEPDRQGRLLLPSQLMKDLGLSGKVMIMGARTNLEIWNPDTYSARKAERAQRRVDNA